MSFRTRLSRHDSPACAIAQLIPYLVLPNQEPSNLSGHELRQLQANPWRTEENKGAWVNS